MLPLPLPPTGSIHPDMTEPLLGRSLNRLARPRRGPGPRAGQALMLCARARALYEGRLAPSIDDVYSLAEPVLEHRMALTFPARAEGMTVRDVIASLVSDLRK